MSKVEPLVLEELSAANRTDFFIWMREKADLSPAYKLDTKEERGQFVYNALRSTAERTQKELRAYLDRQGVSYRPFYISNKILVRGGSQNLLSNVTSRPDVAKITANHHYQLPEPMPSPRPSQVLAIEPNISFINADDVWAMGHTGEGTVMAGNDTGLAWDHSAIIDQYRGWDGSSADHNYNWWDATSTYPSTPDDGHGHGTHTTGTMVGDDGGANQIGVAPGARTIHCKNMTDGGGSSDATFTECFEWDLAPWDLNGLNPRPDLAPDAINNSWGYWGGGNTVFEDEIAALHAAGILVEVSAGNEGPSCSTLRSPGDYDEVLTTGSVDHSGGSLPGTITSFSSRGPSSIDPGYFPDIMAPGENIRSSLPGDTYASWNGTSMAGPHTTALIGLMWSANPGLRGMITETMDIIKDTAVPLTGQSGSSCGGDYTDGPNNDWGYGTIDALAAVEQAMQYGGTGVLEGTITDGASNFIFDATVQATLSPTLTWQATSDVSGTYSMVVFSGTYTVDAYKYGHMPARITGVSVVSGTTTTQDITLPPASYHVVSGTVTDNSTGDPLWATVDIAGDPVDPPTATLQTDRTTGYYSITLAGGITYTFDVDALMHDSVTRTVGPLTGDTTENFALVPTTTNGLVAGWVFDEDTGIPIENATVEVDGGPSATTDAEGYYQTALVSPGFYTATASARLYSSETITDIEVPQSNIGWADFYLPTPHLEVSPTVLSYTLQLGDQFTQTPGLVISNTGDGRLDFELQERERDDYALLVDDDFGGSYDALPYFEAALIDFGISYDVFDTGGGDGPTAAQMTNYDIVIWFSGDTFGGTAGPNATDESSLAAYLDAGGALFLTSQDYHYDMGLTSFMQAYLGVSSATDDVVHISVTGVPGDPIGDAFDTISLEYPGDNYSDNITPDGTASAAFSGSAGDYAAIDKEDSYRTIFFGFPWEAIQSSNPQDGKAVMQTVLGWLAPVDIPWLTEDPITGTVASSGTQNIDIGWWANVAEVDQPGTYYAGLKIKNNDPNNQNMVLPVTMTVTPPATWGKLQGIVSTTGHCDVNPALLEDAEVLIENGATISTTTDVSGTYDYWLDEGTYTVTVSAAEHLSDTAVVTISAQATTTHNVSLRWLQPCVSVAPPNISATLDMGLSTTLPLSISNSGAIELAFELQEQDRGSSVLGSPLSGAGQWLYRSDTVIRMEVNGGDTKMAYPSAYRWQPTGFPAALNVLIYADDFVHTAPNTYLDQALQALGYAYTAHYDGDFIGFETDLTTGGPWDIVLFGNDNYAPPASTWAALDDYVNAGGKLALHTWQVSSDPSNALWTTLGFTFMSDVTTGDDVYWWEPEHMIFEGVPEFIGLNSAGGVQGQRVEPLFGFDSPADYTTPGPDPNEAGLILGNSGRTVFRGFLDAGNDLNNDGDSTLDGIELWMNLIEGLQVSFSSDVPWLSEDPITGTVAADGGLAPIDVTLDATQVAQPGEYYATLNVNSDDPYSSTIGVPVTMTVNVPATYGKLEGIVSSDRPAGPLEGAFVNIISGTTSIYSTTTDASGSYGPRWLWAGDYTVTVSADGYFTDTQAVIVTAQQTTTHDVTLTVNAPQIEVAPTSLSETVPWRGMVTRTLTISNIGTLPLDFEIYEVPDDFGPSLNILSESEGPTALPSDVPGVQVVKSTADGIVLDVHVTGLTTSKVRENGTEYRRLRLPYSGATTEVGKPALPTFGRFLALPQGAQVEVEVLEANSEAVTDILVYPAQEPQPDGAKTQGKPPFVIDEEFYAQNVLYPGRVATVDTAKKLRGSQVTVVRFYPYQYNPARRELTTYSHLRVRVRFVEATGPFIKDRYRASSFENLYRRLLLNYEQLGTAQPQSHSESATGAEFLIITHPNFDSAADDLATWRNTQGIDTEVRTTDDTGATAAEIRAYIQNAYDTWSPPPEFVLFLGDAEFVPTNYTTTHPYHGTMIGTDLYYATVDGSDYYPDIHTGRISVDTFSEAQKTIGDIIDYDRDPVNEEAFYENASMAAYFQDDDDDGYEDRRFVLTSEEIRDYLMTQGYTVERIYYTSSSVDPTHYNNGLYANGEPLPPDLLRPTFAWDGDSSDITAAVSEGRFILNHRDHGATWGWGDPYYSVSDVQMLTNGDKLPVVFSMNCQTGWFDNETDDPADGTPSSAIHFSEAWQRNPNGGAIGVMGATRVSYSGYNDWMTEGFYDAIWPEFLAYNEPGFARPEYRMGAVLNYGKLAMEALWGDAWGLQRVEFEMFQYFGDPTTGIHTRSPMRADVPWLNEEPISGTVPVDNALDVDVAFNADVVDQPGAYTAQLQIASNDPFAWTSIPVTMTVITPPSWGRLQGTVQSLGHCDANPVPLEGAEVLIENGTTVSVTTDVSGTYTYWLEEGVYTVTVSSNEHLSDIAVVNITAQATTTHDVSLRWLQPCVDVAPPSISATLDLGLSTTLPMSISNSGALSTVFELIEADRGGTILSALGGGPDPFGYTYMDSNESGGPTYDFVDISTTGTPVSLGDDDYAGPFDLGFTLDFYGTEWTQYYIGSNGFLSFGSGASNLGNDCPLPSTNTPNNLVAMHWDDLNPSAGGTIYRQSFDTCPYYGAGACEVVMFDDVPHFGGSSAGVFEVILFENGSMLMQYQDPGVEAGSSATTGIENDDGTVGLTYATCNSTYLSADLAVCFAYPGNPSNCTPGDVPWLSENPITGTVNADSAFVVDVTFDTMTYTQGTYIATLLVDTDDAVNDPISVPVTMTITAAPDCGFVSSSPDEWRETTYFTNTTIGAAPLTYVWDFGDGTPVSTLENPTHTYAHVGFYTVVLTATNAHGTDVCSDTVSIEGVEGGFTSNSPVDLGQATIFTNTTLANPSIQQYFWTFGDSTSSEEEHPTHTYAAPGIYTVTLFASNVPGVLNVYDIHQETVEVHAATSYGVQVAPRTATAEGVSAVPVFYTLQVDNTGNISETFDIDAASNWTTTVPSAIGPLEAGEDSNIVVTVTIPSTALDGATDSSIITVASQTDPNQSATAILTTTSRNRYSVALAPPAGTQSGSPSDLMTYTLRVTNTGNTVDMLTTTLSGYNWSTDISGDIGELDSGEGKDVKVMVEIPSDAQDGDHDNVIVTVASQNNPTKADTSTLTTTAFLACEEVSIEALTSDSPVTLGDPMHFTATVTGTTLITYAWDFDNDGTPDETGVGLDVISHTYSSAGTYTVTLDVENECSTDTHPITISAAPVCTDVTSVDLSQVTRGTIYTDTEVTFEADIAPDDAAKPYTYTIDYGDDISTTATSSDDSLTEITHTFTATGSYDVEIAVWNCEMSDPVTDTVAVTVSEYGTCVDLTDITIKGDTTGYSGAYTFTTTYSPSNATLPISYTWDNGDTTSTTLRVLDVGTHTLRVTATNISTTWVTDTHTINLQPISPEPKIYLPLVLKNQ